MSLIQFLRILAARRMIIIVALVSCFLVAMVVAQRLPARYQATARLMMDVFKPDPITGEVVASRSMAAYTRTQIELIEDYRTAGAVVDRLGWVNDPALISEYYRSTNGVNPDIRRWLADRIIAGTDATMIQGTNILQISYVGGSPAAARAIVEAIRDVYMAATLEGRRSSSSRVRDWFRRQSEQTLQQLTAAEAARSQYAKANNIVLTSENGQDLESAKLQALSSQSATAGLTTQSVAGTSPVVAQLAQIDAQIQQAQQTLGPNHPQLQALRRQRAVVAATGGKAAISGGGISVAGVNAAFDAQRRRVLGERDKLDKLQQLQRDIDLKREQYQKMAQRAAELQVEAEAGETGLSMLGDASAPNRPIFPNIPLIVIGSTAFGLAIGLIAALLVELMGRRVRSDDDLEIAAGAPVLAIVGQTEDRGAFVRWLKSKLSRRKDGVGELASA